MMRYTKGLGALLLAATLAACGGGGGSAGSNPNTVTPGTGTPGTPTTTPGTGTTATTTTVTSSGSLSLALVNTAGTAVHSIDSSGGFVAKATVTDAAGAVQAGKVVTFSLPDASIATVTPATALTDATGLAQVTIAPTSLNSIGATTLSASAVIGTTTVTATKDFGVSASNLSLSAVSAGNASLPSGGNTALTVTALVNGTAATSTPVNVVFSANCGRINGQGTSSSTTTSGNGVASATYTAVNADGTLCSGPVTITASSAGAAPRTAQITVAAAMANAITFATATPQQIFISGTGAFEQSAVTFKVLSGTTPMANQTVTFSLAVNPGGVGLNAAGNTTPVTGSTDANGNATVTVFSGTIPGPLQVRAQLAADATIFALSQNLTVASGPPSQRFMSVSVQTFNIEGWAIDGTPTRITARVADRQGNAVQNGTVVNFTAEGGQVGSSCQTAQVNNISSCSVDFISQNPRPAGGRASVLAYTNGTKDYVDVNGNNRFDAGTDQIVDIGDAYRDDDEDAVFDNGEFVVTRGGATACPSAGEPFPSRANTCDGLLGTTVRQQSVILFSSSEPQLTVQALNAGVVRFSLASRDNPLLPMPAGTTITATTRDATTGNAVSCAVNKTSPSTVPNVGPTINPNANLATVHEVALDNCASGDQVLVDIKAPSGLTTPFTFTIP